MSIALEQSQREELMDAQPKRTRREGRNLEEMALELGLKMMQGQKDLNDQPGSWADDPDFERCVLDFRNV
jgi:hypothetical protein